MWANEVIMKKCCFLFVLLSWSTFLFARGVGILTVGATRESSKLIAHDKMVPAFGLDIHGISQSNGATFFWNNSFSYAKKDLQIVSCEMLLGKTFRRDKAFNISFGLGIRLGMVMNMQESFKDQLEYTMPGIGGTLGMSFYFTDRFGLSIFASDFACLPGYAKKQNKEKLDAINKETIDKRISDVLSVKVGFNIRTGVKHAKKEDNKKRKPKKAKMKDSPKIEESKETVEDKLTAECKDSVEQELSVETKEPIKIEEAPKKDEPIINEETPEKEEPITSEIPSTNEETPPNEIPIKKEESLPIENTVNTVQKPSYLPTPQEILDELNLVRTNPQDYAKFLQEHIDTFEGFVYIDEKGRRVKTSEGVSAVYECIEALQNLPPMEALSMNDNLCTAALWLAEDQARSGKTGHVGSDGSKLKERTKKAGFKNGYLGENCSYGYYTARDFIMGLLIDDNVPSRGHRANIMKREFSQVGIGLASGHPQYDTVLVTDFGD